MSRIRWYGPTLVLLATVLSVMIAGPSVAREMAYSYQKENIQLVRESIGTNPVLDDMRKAFRQVSTVVEPSVVHLSVAARQNGPRQGGQGNPGDMERLREWFFGPRNSPPPTGPQDGQQAPMDPRDPRSQQGPQGPRGQGQPDAQDFDQYNPARPYGNGSGWVYDNNGHIVTNNHVIDGADVITVRFHDGTERTATVVGTDPKTDIAVLKVEGGNLHPAVVSPESVQQGDIVFAFGSPFGFKFSMSQGIVSAVGRNELGIIRGGYEDFIQTDAAINPGNSGGPLTDIHGEVVGMNTAIASRTGSNNGLGFAIPSSNILTIVQALINDGKVIRGFLGIEIGDLDARMANTFGYQGKGVLVLNPIPGTPGEKAGLKEGDIIVALDKLPMTSADTLRNTVAAIKPDTAVTLDVFRDGKHVDVKVIVGQLPDEIAQAQAPVLDEPVNPEAASLQVLLKLGIERVFPINAEFAQRYNIKGTDKGLLVQAVRRNSAAAVSGIVPGVVITQVMGNAVGSVNELAAELNKHDLSQGVRVRVMAEGRSYFVVLQISNP